MGRTKGKLWVIRERQLAGAAGAALLAAACAGADEGSGVGDDPPSTGAELQAASGQPVDPVAHGTTEVEAGWAARPANGARAGKIAVELSRQPKGSARVRPVLVVAGLDGQEVREPLEPVELHAGGPRRVTIDLEALPLQAEHGLVQVAVEVQLPRGGVVSTEPLYVEHEAGYAGAKVYDADGALGRGAAGSRGRRRNGAAWDEWAEPTVAASAARGSVPFAVGASRASAEEPSRLAAPTEGEAAQGAAGGAAAPAASTVKICARWRVQHVDTGLGEDVWTDSGWRYRDASFAFAAVYTQGGGTLKWAGYLDGAGCSPSLTLPAGNYELRQSTGATTYSGRVFNVYQVTGGSPAFTVVTTNFYWANTTTGTVQINPTFNNQAVQAAPVVGRLLLTHALTDLGIASGTYSVRMNQDCPGIPGNGCVSGGIVYVPGAQSSWKNIIAHELGHQVQGAAMGTPFYDYDQNATEYACKCDHVVSANAYHCMNSREHTGAAQIEGWAHFVAARLFNTSTQSNCSYVYYKEFLEEGGGGFLTVSAPPVAVNCYEQRRWMENYCLASSRGTEWDWMNFYWKVNTTGGTAKSTVTQLHEIYRKACQTHPANCDFTRTVHWTQALNGAYLYYGSNYLNPGYLHFANRGNDHGVSH